MVDISQKADKELYNIRQSGDVAALKPFISSIVSEVEKENISLVEPHLLDKVTRELHFYSNVIEKLPEGRPVSPATIAVLCEDIGHQISLLDRYRRSA